MRLALHGAMLSATDVDVTAGLIELARESGVRMVACTMSMDVMGIQPAELIEGVEYGGVARFPAAHEVSPTQLFI